jgi:hypothetical protein
MLLLLLLLDPAGDAGGGYCWRPAVRVFHRRAEQPSGAQVQLRRGVGTAGHYRAQHRGLKVVGRPIMES